MVWLFMTWAVAISSVLYSITLILLTILYWSFEFFLHCLQTWCLELDFLVQFLLLPLTSVKGLTIILSCSAGIFLQCIYHRFCVYIYEFTWYYSMKTETVSVYPGLIKGLAYSGHSIFSYNNKEKPIKFTILTIFQDMFQHLKYFWMSKLKKIK